MLDPDWLGRRVSVRRVVERAASGRLLQADVVGELVGLDAQTAVVQTRTGPVEVPVALVTAARPVAPSTAQVLALEEIVAKGWRPAEFESFDGWRLRADHGFTKRANSVLALRQLHLPLDDALAQAERWYAARDLPLLIQLPTEARRLLDAGLAERGWTAATLTHVLERAIDAGSSADPSVELAGAPDGLWLAMFRSGAADTPTGRALLTRHPRVCFASIRDGADTVAIGRATVDDGWLGITSMAVDPRHRRRGLARTVATALWAWGAARGATRTHLEVENENHGAAAAYARLGYRPHHDYHYRRPAAEPFEGADDGLGIWPD